MYRVRAVVAVAPTNADYTMPSKGEIKNLQDIEAEGKLEINTALGKTVRSQDSAYRVEH